MRSLQELVTVDEPAWPTVQSWIREASNPVEVLPANPVQRERALLDSQVSVRSPVGAIIYETGGILVTTDGSEFLAPGTPNCLAQFQIGIAGECRC